MTRLIQYACRVGLLLLLFAGVPATLRAQGAADAVATGLTRGDAAAVGRYFADPVEITLAKSRNSYSATQAEMVLRDWFAKNNPKEYHAEHSGASSGSTVSYSIGQLTTGTGKYRVYMLFKQRDGKPYLAELRIEKL